LSVSLCLLTASSVLLFQVGFVADDRRHLEGFTLETSFPDLLESFLYLLDVRTPVTALDMSHGSVGTILYPRVDCEVL
jgi:hypothetical protein